MTSLPMIPAPFSARADIGECSIESGALISASCSSLLPVAELFAGDVQTDCGLVLRGPVVGERDALIRLELVDSSIELASLPATHGVRAAEGDPDDERHGIDVAADRITVWASTVEGVARGLTSLRQLLAAGLRADGSAEASAERHSAVAAMRVVDTPRFAWRGLSLDVARTFHPAAQVKRVIDMLALHKLNVLHLHLTDDQGWRIPIDGWPRLTEISSATASDGRVTGAYTVDELRDLVEYAKERYVTIVPEVDMPGHTATVLAAYPRLGDGGNLTPDSDETWRFVTDVLSQVSMLFPDSRYLHIGGDEAFGMDDDEHATFVSRASEIVRGLGHYVAGWQESSRGALSSDDIVQFWIEPEIIDLIAHDQHTLADVPDDMRAMLVDTFAKAQHDVPSARAQGARVIASPHSSMYLDRPYAETSHDRDQDALQQRLGMPLYPAATIRAAYEADPVDAVVGLDTRDAVVGIEGAVWCESVLDGADLEFLLMPRLAGIGEAAWSPRSAIDWLSYRDRLARVSTVWEARGWNWFRSSGVTWEGCAKEAEGVAAI